jgi:hypothetical protein
MRDNHHIYRARLPRLLTPKIALRRILVMLGHLHLLFPSLRLVGRTFERGKMKLYFSIYRDDEQGLLRRPSCLEM